MRRRSRRYANLVDDGRWDAQRIGERERERGIRLTSTLRQTNSVASVLDDYEFLIAPIIFTALAFFTRMWKIGLSPIVTWDEAQ